MVKILSAEKVDMAKYNKKCSCNVYSVLIEVTDIHKTAQDMIIAITDTSWIDELNVIDQATFSALSVRTINKLANNIFSKVEDEVTVDFGEYMVSMTAQDALTQEPGHTSLPLADIIKEKVTGNPGFDFHTCSHSGLLSFGEAKYSGINNPYSNALTQINDFINLEKDTSELVFLKAFISEETALKCIAGEKAYIAAFSINTKTPKAIMDNVFKSMHIDSLLKYPEIYIVGVVVDA